MAAKKPEPELTEVKLSDADVYGEAVERPYKDALDAKHREVLAAAGQLPE